MAGDDARVGAGAETVVTGEGEGVAVGFETTDVSPMSTTNVPANTTAPTTA